MSLIKLQHLLYEARQAGILYHFTSYINLLNILYSNSLRARTLPRYNPYIKKFDNTISLTRDKSFNQKSQSLLGLDVGIIIDGNKLSNNYKIKPYSFYKTPTKNEFEEIVFAKEIKNFKNYIIGITVKNKNKVIDITDTYSFLKEKIHDILNTEKDILTHDDFVRILKYFGIKYIK